MYYLIFYIFLAVELFSSITAKVNFYDYKNSSFNVTINSSEYEQYLVNESYTFKLDKVDLLVNYVDKIIKFQPLYYSNKWYADKLLPISGFGSKAYKDTNNIFNKFVSTSRKRDFVREGDFILPFIGINQNGDFFEVNNLDKPFILNFIFTKCNAPLMCPLATQKMAALQKSAKMMELDISFISISFDPLNDTPSVLNQYAKSYSIESSNYNFLTFDVKTTKNLLKYFGISTIQDDGTINHTMATLLVNFDGRILYRKDGSTWTIDAFLDKIEEIFNNES